MEKLCGPYIDRRVWEKEPGYEARLEYHHTTGVLHRCTCVLKMASQVKL